MKVGPMIVMFLALARCAHANDVAVVVGVSDYKAYVGQGQGDLKYADADARLFAKTLTDQMHVKDKDVLLLTSNGVGEHRATARNILAAIAKAAMSMRDPIHGRFFFYFSGHGVETEKGPLLAACDFDPAKPAANGHDGLTATKISATLSSLNVGFAIAIFDMCRPGYKMGADAETSERFGVRKQRAGHVANIYSSVYGPSYESDAFGQGFFTYFLCKGITPQQTSSLPVVGAMDDDGLVTLNSLSRYVQEQLYEFTGSLAAARDGPVAPREPLNAKGTPTAALGQRPLFDAPGMMEQELRSFDRSKFRREKRPDQRFYDLRDDGMANLGAQNFMGAAKSFEAAFGVPTGNPKLTALAALYAGNAFFNSGQPDAAERWYGRAIEADPTNATSFNNLGRLIDGRTGPDSLRAEKLYRRAIEVNPKFAKAMFNLGCSLQFRSHDEVGAEKQYLGAIKADPTYYKPMYNLAIMYDRVQHKPEKAVPYYKRTIAANPNFADARNSYGRLLSDFGSLREAQRQFEQALRVNPENEIALGNLGRALVDRENLSETEKALAKQVLLKAIAIKPDFLGHKLTLGWLLHQNYHDENAALEQFNAVLAIDPKNAAALSNIGEVYERQKLYEKAKAQYLAAIAVDEEFATARQNLAHLLETNLQDPEGAELQYRECCRLEPDLAEHHEQLASLLLKRGKVAEAKIEAQKAKDLESQLSALVKRLGIGGGQG